MVSVVLEALRQVLLWPGETVIGWLLASYPQLAAWLGVSPGDAGGLFSAGVSVMVGWGLFGGICHLLLFVVQRWEARQARRDTDTVA